MILKFFLIFFINCIRTGVLLKNVVNKGRQLEGFDYKLFQQYDQQLADHLIDKDYQEEVS